jgi:DNA-binding transcriptional ArsR family regulator
MTDDRAGAVFGALADPTRRLLLGAIADGAAATATELASGLPISRQAVVKHLTALADAGLLQRERAGREVRYRVTPEPLSDAVSWMAEVGGQWDERLASLASALSPGGRSAQGPGGRSAQGPGGRSAQGPGGRSALGPAGGRSPGRRAVEPR